MYKCSRCGCRCDAGELHGGVCDDCREEEKSLELLRKMRAKSIAEQTDGQLVMRYGAG